MTRTGNRCFYTSMIISFFVHGVLIAFLPGISPPRSDDNQIGSYTQVQLIRTPLSGKKKEKGTTAPVEGKISVPEMDPAIKNQMSEIRDISMPLFDLSLPQRKELPPLSGQDFSFQEDTPIEEEMMEELKTSLPLPQPAEALAQREEDFPRPPLEEFNFEAEQLVDEIMEDTYSDDMDIEWSGKPRQIVSKPLHPPTYPSGYKGQLEGKIRLQFWVDADGFVIRVRPAEKLDPRLDAVATEYVRQYRFEPLGRNQKNETQWGIIPFSFRLE
jgi:TonB family protein